MPGQSEAFSRILIDHALTDSGWDLLDPRQVRFETRAGGRIDYVLLDNKGMALCVLEAKREDHDPYDAKEQARGYAENLRSQRLFNAAKVIWKRARLIVYERIRDWRHRIPARF